MDKRVLGLEFMYETLKCNNHYTTRHTSYMRLVNPSSPNNDQHEISPCNINVHSTPEVMRIKDMITQGEFS